MAPPEVQLTGPAAALLAFNTRTTTLAVRCPDREYGCEHLNLPILRLNCDSQQISLPNVVEGFDFWSGNDRSPSLWFVAFHLSPHLSGYIIHIPSVPG